MLYHPVNFGFLFSLFKGVIRDKCELFFACVRHLILGESDFTTNLVRFQLVGYFCCSDKCLVVLTLSL